MAATACVWILGGTAAMVALYYVTRGVIWVIDFVIDSSERWEG